MFGLAALVVLLVGMFVSDVYQHPHSPWFWVYIGLMLMALAVSNVQTLIKSRT